MIVYSKSQSKSETPKEESTGALRVMLNGHAVYLTIEEHGMLEIFCGDLDVYPVAVSSGGVNVLRVGMAKRGQFVP